MKRWNFEGVSGELKDQRFPLANEQIWIGRTSDNHIIVPEKNVSRRHAMLNLRNNECWIKDMKSKNGTFVNEQRISEVQLFPNDIVRICSSSFKIILDSPVSQSAIRPLNEAKEWKSQNPSVLPHQENGQFIEQIKHVDKGRFFLYGTALLVMGLLGFSLLQPSKTTGSKKATSGEEIGSFSIKMDPNLAKASEEEVSSWLRRAEEALQFDDVLSAIEWLQKVVAARPGHERARVLLSRCEGKAKRLIGKYEENGAREFEKLYFDKAIEEWRKAQALSYQYDPATYRKVGEKIREAETKLAQKPQ